MERIIRHFMGDVSFTSRNLQDIADTLEQDCDGPRSRDTMNLDDQAISESYSLEPLSTSLMCMPNFVHHIWAPVDDSF